MNWREYQCSGKPYKSQYLSWASSISNLLSSSFIHHHGLYALRSQGKPSSTPSTSQLHSLLFSFFFIKINYCTNKPTNFISITSSPFLFFATKLWYPLFIFHFTRWLFKKFSFCCLIIKSLNVLQWESCCVASINDV